MTIPLLSAMWLMIRRIAVRLPKIGTGFKIPPGRLGLIFGYATLDEATIERGVKRLAAALREAT
jgi:DNA-binding transcriptional MocR family regulator